MPPKLPVSDPAFWKERLQLAKKNGQQHYSVYLCNPTKWQAIYEAHKMILRKEITTTGKVLDAGCGFGRMAALFDPNKYTGVDISPDLLVIAKRENPKKYFALEDLKSLPYKDLEFDFAFCISIKQMIEGNLGKPEWQKIEKELKRVAQKVIILEYEEPELYTVL